ncbi:hypothetical protein FSP39_014676 [Pinctada imbricata]|uniref:Ubiquitin-like protein 7 n=1 Tax=Pinctada imbricata TaxID=66713 RepID=A0AA89C3J3_PINIB|nr:hypothetical protein FSP39_014676 [Pinctada imbricata]
MVSCSLKVSKLIYCGQKLDDTNTLISYGLKDGCTVFALKKHIEESQAKPDSMSDMGIRQLVSTLQSALLNPAYRNTVERILNSSESLENIIAATPGLSDDPVAISMLQDQELLAILAHPGNIKQVIEKHPAFGQAAIMIASAVSEEGGSKDDRTSTGSYSLDQMSDEEDEGQINRPGPSGGRGAGGITPSQLAAALAAATGMSPQQSDNNQVPGGGVITPDFFQQAIRQAQTVSNNNATSVKKAIFSRVAKLGSFKEHMTQLQQLRDMGITDEALARRALQATGGDLQAALDILFGDGNF